MSHPGYLHGPLQVFSPENGVCNYEFQKERNSCPRLQSCYIGSSRVGVSQVPQDPLAMSLGVGDRSLGVNGVGFLQISTGGKKNQRCGCLGSRISNVAGTGRKREENF